MVTTGQPSPRRQADLLVTATLTGGIAAYLLFLRGRPDVDLWLHLRIGELLRSGVRFGLPDPIAQSVDQRYVPTSWLAQVGMSQLWDLGGMPAVQLTRLACVALLVTGVWAATRRVADPRPAIMVTLAAVFASGAGWGERPQVLGLALLALVSASWWHAVTGGRVPWELVPVMWVWAGIHGTWLLGLGVTWAIVGIAIVDDRLRGPRLWRLVLVAGLSSVAVLLTPLGPGLVGDVFSVGRQLRGHVNEWLPPTITNPLWVVVLGLAAFTLVGWARRRRIPVGRLTLLIGTVILAAGALRLVAPAAIVIAPLAAGAWSGGGARGVARPVTAPSRRELGALALGPLVLLVAGGWLAIAQDHPAPIGTALSRSIGQIPAGSVIAAPAEVTGWLVWAHPDLLVLRDLRSEAYSPQVGEEYERAVSGDDFVSYLRTHDVTAVLSTPTAPTVPALRSAGWTVAAAGDGLDLWRAP